MDGIVWIVLAYFIGAIPSGYIIGRVFYGVNLKKVGSGNIGATNAYRELGAVAGLSVFICDFLKGFLAVHLGMPDPTLVLACAIFAIVGNDWSVFLKFKSGKGVACGVGAFADFPGKEVADESSYDRCRRLGDSDDDLPRGAA